MIAAQECLEKNRNSSSVSHAAPRKSLVMKRSSWRSLREESAQSYVNPRIRRSGGSFSKILADKYLDTQLIPSVWSLR